MSGNVGFMSAIALAAPPAAICAWGTLKFFEKLVEKQVIPAIPRKDAVKVVLVLAFMAWTVALAGIASHAYTAASPSERKASPAATVAAAPEAAAAAPVAMPENGGWVFAGYFHKAGMATEDVMVAASELSEIQRGRSVVLTADREVRVLDFRTDPQGWQKRPSSRTKGTGSQDRTDVILRKGQRVMIRQVDRYADGDLYGLWLRVVPMRA